MNVAILVDGAFFLKRYKKLFNIQEYSKETAEQMGVNFYTYVHKHARDKYLYRIFYYDCFPLDKKAHNPITKKSIDFKKTPQYEFRTAFFEELKRKRKVALRIGDIRESNNWLINPKKTKELLNGKLQINQLQEKDVYFDMVQKGVDIRIGVDIASLAYKRLVQQIILISGDSDFVPAAKVARREGIDFVLDPMHNHINPALFEHIDGLKSYSPKPVKSE